MLDDLAAAYAQALASIGGAFVEAFTDLLSAFDLSDRASAERLVPAAHRVIQRHRRQAVEAANDYLDASAAPFGALAYHPEPESYTVQAVRKLFRENQGATPERLAAAARRHVVMAGRRQVMRSVLDAEFDEFASEDERERHERGSVTLEGFDEALAAVNDSADEALRRAEAEADNADADSELPRLRPVGWARVLQGRWSCGFCIMLAARGAVYSSADAAQLVAAEAGKKSREGGFLSRRARTELRKRNPRAFHEHCDCIVVPVFDPENWSGRAEQQRLQDFYQRVMAAEDSKLRADPENYKPVKVATLLDRAVAVEKAAGPPEEE
nr:MAG TPA: minor capsid protein [Caudoviricetes sp.]